MENTGNNELCGEVKEKKSIILKENTPSQSRTITRVEARKEYMRRVKLEEIY